MATPLGISRVPRDQDVQSRRNWDKLAALYNELARLLNLETVGAGRVKLKVNVADIPAHATTHESGGTDEISVLLLGGFPGGGTTFLRDDATFVALPFPLFDHFADAGNGTTVETDLYSDTLADGQLAVDGDKIEAWYSGVTVGHATATRQIRVYFGGTLIYDSTAQVTAAAANWSIGVRVIRESSSVVRCDVSFDDNLNLAAFPGSQYTRITGLTLADPQILKITGQAGGVGAATDDIVAKLGSVKFWPAA